MPLFVEYLRQFARFQRNARLYLISSALSGVTIGIILVLYNLYLQALGYGPDFIGWALFAVALGAGLMIFPAGLCVDRLSGRFILIWGSVFIGIAGVGQFLVRQPIPLLLCDFLAGAAGAFLLVLNAPFLTRYSTSSERSLLFSFNIVVTLATTVLGELLGGFLPGWFQSNTWLMGSLPMWLSSVLAQAQEPRSYQFALMLAGIIAAPSFIPVFMMSNERPEPVPVRGERISLGAAIRSAVHWYQKVGIRSILLNPLTVLLLFVVLISLGRGFFVPYFNLYFVNYLGASPALFGVIDGTANALTALFTLGTPLLAMRIGKVNTVILTRLISIPLLLALGFIGIIPIAVFLYPLRQGTMDMSAGVFQVFFMEQIAPQRRGIANSWYQAADQIGATLTTPLGGLIISNVGYQPVFIIGAGVYVVAIFLLWLRFRQKMKAVI